MCVRACAHVCVLGLGAVNVKNVCVMLRECAQLEQLARMHAWGTAVQVLCCALYVCILGLGAVNVQYGESACGLLCACAQLEQPVRMGA